MNLIRFLVDFFEYMSGRAFIIWFTMISMLLIKSYKPIKSYLVQEKKTAFRKTKKLVRRYGLRFVKLKKKLYKRKGIKQILIGTCICFISFVLLIFSGYISENIESDVLNSFSSFLYLVILVSACVSIFLLFKEIALHLFGIAISGNSKYKTKKTIILIKMIYYILMLFWGGVLFIFGGTELEIISYDKWPYMLGGEITSLFYISYFLLLIATILLLFTLLSIVFSYDLKAEKISERIKFIAFNYFQIVLLLTGLVTCSKILFGDFEGVLTEITIKGFLNCLYTVFLSLQDISILYNEAGSAYGKIVLIICSLCNLLFIGMFVGTFLEKK